MTANTRAFRQVAYVAIALVSVVSPNGMEMTLAGEQSAVRPPTPADADSRLSRPGNGQPPDWLADAIWYQVFVTRFRNGEPANDPAQTVEWTRDWFRLLDGEKPPLRDRLFHRAHGGDLQGIAQAIPYFKSLGVNTLYLNPIFAAESQHKYDTTDHRHVDDSLAISGSLDRVTGEPLDPQTWRFTDSDRVFLDLIARCHAAGIRVVIDGVFNHVGQEFFGWRDVLKNGKHSPFATWFDVVDWGPPIQYNAWDGPNGHLVEFRRDENGLDPGAEAYIFSVIRRWMDPDGDGDPSDGVDGWRLDVADKPPHAFWRRFRQVVKEVNPNACIIGEVWPSATDWLEGDQFDAVTNYRFRDAAIKLAGRARPAMQPTEFARAIDRIIDDHRWSVSLSMMNLLDSHDTGRAVTVLAMDSSVESDAAMRRPDQDAYERLRLAALLQFTLPGAPMIYYGDEIGMYGGNDPQCRAPMLWKDQNVVPAGDETLRKFYEGLCQLRSERPSLRRGLLQWVHVDDRGGILAFRRLYDGEELLVVVNLTGKPRTISLNPGDGVRRVSAVPIAVNYYHKTDYKFQTKPVGLLEISLGGQSGAIFEVFRSRDRDED